MGERKLLNHFLEKGEGNFWTNAIGDQLRWFEVDKEMKRTLWKVRSQDYNDQDVTEIRLSRVL